MGKHCTARAAEEDVVLEGWGEIISAAKETAPVGVALVGPRCTFSYGFLHRHGCCTKDFSLQLSITALGIASSEPCMQCLKMDARVPLEVPARASVHSLLLLCSERNGSAPGLRHNEKKKKKKYTYFILRVQGCKTRALAGLLALAFAPAVPYLADGACKTHPVMLSHRAAEDL